MIDKREIEQEELFRHQIYQSFVGLSYFELHSTENLISIDLNKSLQKQLQLPYGHLEVTCEEFYELIDEKDRSIAEPLKEIVQNLAIDEEYRTEPHRLHFPYAVRSIWVITVFKRVSNELVNGVHVDVSDIYEKQIELKKTRDEFEILLNNTTNLFVHYKRNGKIIDANKAFRNAYNLTVDTVKDANFFKLNDEERITDVTGKKVTIKDKTEGAVMIRLDGNPVRYIRWTFHPMQLPQTTDIIGIGHDITSIVELNQKLEYDSLHDEETGFYNPDGLKRKLKEMENQNLVAYFIHLTNFNDINDFYGHSFGSRLLGAVARRMEKALPKGAIIARMTMEKFIVIESFSLQSVGRLSHVNFYREITKPLNLHQQRVYLNARIGYCFYPSDAKTINELITNSRLACSYAIENDFRYARFEQAIYRRFQEQISLSSDLKRAIENEEINLVFQPVFNTRTNKFETLEVFARWKHPVKGNIPPVVFFKLAERAGFVDELDYYIIARSLREFKTIKENEQYKDIRLSINITHKTLLEPLLNQYLQRMIQQLGINFSDVYLEINENTFVNDQEAVIRQIERLRELGVHIVLDDFGSEYSSLSFLDSVNIDTIKVDQSFVKKLPKVSTEKILQMIATIGGVQKKRVIIEGVESNEQIRRLTKLGYYLFQGFYYAMPKNSTELLAAVEFR